MNIKSQINELKKQKELLQMFSNKKEEKQTKQLNNNYQKVKKLGKHPLAN